jgi:hypothetical protein
MTGNLCGGVEAVGKPGNRDTGIPGHFTHDVSM